MRTLSLPTMLWMCNIPLPERQQKTKKRGKQIQGGNCGGMEVEERQNRQYISTAFLLFDFCELLPLDRA